MKKQIRKQIIVNPAVQFKMIFLIILSILLPTFLTFMCLYFLINSILMDAQINDETVYAALLFLSRKVYLLLATGFVFISALLICWGMIFIHRIVGPLYRLERELGKVLTGTKITKLRFRKHDCFKSLAEKINQLIAMIP